MTEAEMTAFVQTLRDKFYPNIDMPEVKFNPRLRTTAGRAWARKIEINQNLGTMVGLEGMKQTLAHEFAHCVQRQQEEKHFVRTKPHGIEWQRIMRALGFEHDRTHKLFDEYKIEAPRSRQRRWEWKCSCMTHQIATVTHNRMMRGEQQRKCINCGTILTRVED